MRVISGKYRGAKLFSPADDRVRPTTDRIKESVFNILSNHVKFCNAKALDLFSGSGALGIEMLSRGAKYVAFVDHDRDSIRLTEANIAKIKAPKDSYGIFPVEYDFALKKLTGAGMDVVFVDPPYALKIENRVLDLIDEYDVLAPGGMVVVEHDCKNIVQNDKYDCDCRKMGNTSVSFMTKKEIK